MGGVSVDRQVFRSQRWGTVVLFVILLAFALLLPVAALLGHWPAGHVLAVVIPIVLLALAGLLAWSGVLRPIRVEFDGTGLAVVRGGRRFALPWSQVRGVGLARDAANRALVAWPATEPAPELVEPYTSVLGFVRAWPGPFAPATYDRTLPGFLLAARDQLRATDGELAAAVERYAPGLWGSPVR